MDISKETLIALPKWQKVLIFLGILLLLSALFWYIFYLPLSTKKSDLDREIKKCLIDLQQKKKAAANLETYKKKKVLLLAKLDEAKKRFPDEKEIPELITSISDIGKRAGLKFQLFRQERNVDKGEYREIPLKLNVFGPFTSTAQFFYEMSRLPRIIQIRDIAMGGYVVVAGDAKIKTSFKALTYMFKKEAPATPQKPKKKE